MSCDLQRYDISITRDPAIAVCLTCSTGFTRAAVLPHLKTHSFSPNPDFTNEALERKKVVRTFLPPSHPIAPLPDIDIYVGHRCGSPGCNEIFSNPDTLKKHNRVQHPGQINPCSAECQFQEVYDSDGSSTLFEVTSEVGDPTSTVKT
jgi:Orsellinic acid/F9775 biosynthesis cluster protein D